MIRHIFSTKILKIQSWLRGENREEKRGEREEERGREEKRGEKEERERKERWEEK